MKEWDPEEPRWITVEQLLMAANVLSTQNPQGPDFDMEQLLQEAERLVVNAQQVIGIHNLELFKALRGAHIYNEYIKKYGGKRLSHKETQQEQIKTIPYDEAVLAITGLKSKKRAIERFKKFTRDHLKYSVLDDAFHRIGIGEDLVPELSREENAHFKYRRSRTNRRNATLKRETEQKSKKGS